MTTGAILLNDRDLTDFTPHYIASHGALVGFSFECPACRPSIHRIEIYWDAIIQPGEQIEATVYEVKDRESFDRIIVDQPIDGRPSCKFYGRIRDGAVTW